MAWPHLETFLQEKVIIFCFQPQNICWVSWIWDLPSFHFWTQEKCWTMVPQGHFTTSGASDCSSMKIYSDRHRSRILFHFHPLILFKQCWNWPAVLHRQSQGSKNTVSLHFLAPTNMICCQWIDLSLWDCDWMLYLNV